MICWRRGGALPAQLPGTTLHATLLIEADRGGAVSVDHRFPLDRS